MLERLKKVCLRSWTVAFAYLKALAGALVAMAPFAAQKLNDPQIAAVLPPAWVGYGLAAVALITFLSRVLPHLKEVKKSGTLKGSG